MIKLCDSIYLFWLPSCFVVSSLVFTSSGCFIKCFCLYLFVSFLCFSFLLLDGESSFTSFDGLGITPLLLGMLDDCFHLLIGFPVSKEYVTREHHFTLSDHDCSNNNISIVVLTSIHEQISSTGPVDQSF